MTWMVGDFGGLEEGGGAVAGLVAMDLSQADAGVVVDTHGHAIPAGPWTSLVAVPGHAVAELLETHQFLMSKCDSSPGWSRS